MARRHPQAKQRLTHSGLVYAVSGRDTEPCDGEMESVSCQPTGVGMSWHVTVQCSGCGKRYTVNCSSGPEATQLMADLRWVFGETPN